MVLVLYETLSDQTLAWMRRVASHTANQESKFIVIGDGIRGSQLQQAAACGLVSTLPWQGSDDCIVRAVMHLQQGRVELPGVTAHPTRPGPPGRPATF